MYILYTKHLEMFFYGNCFFLLTNQLRCLVLHATCTHLKEKAPVTITCNK